MEVQLQDGTGDGHRVKVDLDHRQHTQSLSISYEDFSVLTGDSFGVLTPEITLTTSTVSYLLYVSNDNTHDLVLSNLVANIGTSTGGANTDWGINFYLAPTGGTLLSAGSVAFVANNNLGSPKVLDATALTGAEGSTLTGGVNVFNLEQGQGAYTLTQKIVVPPGTSFALGLTPPSGNTSVKVVIGATLIKQTLDFN